MSAVQTISPTLARRLFISKQKLAGPRPKADPEGMLDVIRDLGCLQLDPTNAVARTHLLVLWSRLGTYDTAHLDKLLWQDRSLFEYWAHAASIVLTEDYPIHRMMMRAYSESNSAWRQWVRDWMKENQELHDYILNELRERGPLLSKDFEDKAARPWASSGLTGGRNVGRMLDFLWAGGKILVAGR
ncbi:MAG TPA: crosslink repair DNA glycosylase YcaQ family protein, partial [Chloroflexia bacterium]|nr:crosslink repair DNA glycosylase YcaQ family protein [Chloroflexia bacterium]